MCFGHFVRKLDSLQVHLFLNSYRPWVSNSIFSSVCNISGSTGGTGGLSIISGPPPYIDWRKFHVSSDICPESAPEKMLRFYYYLE